MRKLDVPVPENSTEMYASGWIFGDWWCSIRGNLQSDLESDNEEKRNGFSDRLAFQRKNIK